MSAQLEETAPSCDSIEDEEKDPAIPMPLALNNPAEANPKTQDYDERGFSRWYASFQHSHNVLLPIPACGPNSTSQTDLILSTT